MPTKINVPVPKAFQSSSAAASAPKPKYEKYLGQKKFDLPKLYVIPEEDCISGDNDADWKYNQNEWFEQIHEAAKKVEKILAKAVKLQQPKKMVPIITLHKTAPKKACCEDQLWTCSKCPKALWETHQIANHLYYHGVGLTSEEFDKLYDL